MGCALFVWRGLREVPLQAAGQGAVGKWRAWDVVLPQRFLEPKMGDCQEGRL